MAKDMDLFLRQDDPNAYLTNYQFSLAQKNALSKNNIIADAANKMTSLAFLVLENEKADGKYTADILDLLKRKELSFEQPVYKTPNEDVYALKFMLAVNTSKDVWNAFIARKDVNVNIDAKEVFQPHCDLIKTYDILNHPRMNVNAKSNYLLFDPKNRSFVAELKDCPVWMIAGARTTLATCDEFGLCSLEEFDKLLMEEKKFALFMSKKPADSRLIGCSVKSGMFEKTCFGFADLSQTVAKIYTQKLDNKRIEKRVYAEMTVLTRNLRKNAINADRESRGLSRQYE